MDNYRIARDRACEYFLRFDHDALIRRWGLKADEDMLYVPFFGRTYGVCRRSGAVTRLPEGKLAGFGETLSVFDLLCHAGEGALPAGTWAPVNSLEGAPRTGVGTDFHSAAAAFFDRDPEGFSRACLALGGTEVPLGDLGFRFALFGPLGVTVKFYRADEEFPAALTLLWDGNMLRFVHYETVFYLAGVVLEAIREEMGRS